MSDIQELRTEIAALRADIAALAKAFAMFTAGMEAQTKGTNQMLAAFLAQPRPPAD